MNDTLEFSTLEGIVNVTMTQDYGGLVDITLKPDNGDDVSITFPLWKFEWLIEQYNQLKN